jgi:hypothetical protein
MRMRQVGRLNVAGIAVMVLALLGGWEAYRGMTQGTPLAWAQTPPVEVDSGDDSKYDYDKDGSKDREFFDHFACYEVYVYHPDRDRYGDDRENAKDYVRIYNQFTKDKDGQYGDVYVKIGRLRLLCVPTYKEHHEDPLYFNK